jgi:hypothetical protein
MVLQCQYCHKEYHTMGYLERHILKSHRVLCAPEISSATTPTIPPRRNHEFEAQTNDVFHNIEIELSLQHSQTRLQPDNIILFDNDSDNYQAQHNRSSRAIFGSHVDSEGEPDNASNSDNNSESAITLDHQSDEVDPSDPQNLAPGRHVGELDTPDSTNPSIRLEYPTGNPGEGFVSTRCNLNPTKDWNPWTPFKDAFDFKAARSLVMNGISKRAIDDMFISGLLNSSTLSFKSATELYKKMANMTQELDQSSWFTGQEVLSNGEKVSYLFRNPVTLIGYLLKQRAYKDEMVYGPVKEFTIEENGNSNRLYSEFHTADWWWNTQASLPRPNGTVIPIILGSDATHLTTYSGGKKAWPIYLTIGNIKSTMRNKPTSAAILILALLPVSASTQNDRNVLHRMISNILEPLGQCSTNGIILQCSDNLDRICFPRLCAWIADYVEYCSLYHLKRNACPICEIQSAKLGSGEIGRVRDYGKYKGYCNTNQIHLLEAVSVHYVADSFIWKLNHIMTSASEMWRPDKLHVILLGILDHLLKWLNAFLKDHDRLSLFSNTWKTIDSYPGVYMPAKAYDEVSQWQGKEMRSFSRIVYVCLAIALSNPSSTERHRFKSALTCTSSLVDFSAMVDYKSHDEDTLNEMKGYLRAFHDNKKIFLQYRASKQAKNTATSASKELRSQLDEEQDTSRLSSKKRRVIEKENRTVIAEERVAVLEELSHFNFPKIHALSHFVPSVRMFGSIAMWSTECMESAHKYQIKEGYRASNRGQTYETQTIQYYNRKHAMVMRQMNLIGYARDGFITDGMADALDLLDVNQTRFRNRAYRNADSSQIAKVNQLQPFFQDSSSHSGQTLLNRIFYDNGKSSIRYVRDVEHYYNIPNLSDHLKTYFRRLQRSNIPCPAGSIENLQVELYNKLRVSQASLDGNGFIVHDIVATGPKTYYGRQRADWAWYMPDLEKDNAYGVLKGRLPCKVLAFLKIRWESYVFRLTYVRRSKPHIVRYDPRTDLHDLPSVTYTEATEPEINSIRSLHGRASLVRCDSSAEHWLVNTRIDLLTFNKIYY